MTYNNSVVLSFHQVSSACDEAELSARSNRTDRGRLLASHKSRPFCLLVFLGVETFSLRVELSVTNKYIIIGRGGPADQPREIVTRSIPSRAGLKSFDLSLPGQPSREI